MSAAVASAREWRDLFTQVPESFAVVLRAIFAEIEAEGAPLHPLHKPRAGARTMQDVFDVLYPQFSAEAFGQAIQPLLRPSLRGFALRAGINTSSLHRMIRGEEPLTRAKIEQVAAAAKVSPAYFREYRQMVVLDAIGQALVEHPAASVTAYKALAGGQGRSRVGS